MARRRNYENPGKHSLGNELKSALAMLDRLQLRVIKAMVQVDFTAHDVVTWLWDDHTREIMHKAYFVVPSINVHNNYSFPTDNCSIRFDWAALQLAAPADDIMDIKPDAHRLFDVMEEVNVIRVKFATARHLVNWMDAHATAGAIRAYWPTMLSLVSTDVIPHAMPKFHHEPEGIAPMLSLLRDTAATVASALVLPEAANIGKTKLVFNARQTSLPINMDRADTMDIESFVLYF